MTKKSRKYLLTINNPIDKGYTHDIINDIVSHFKYEYYCLCDEVGENGTPHTHIYFYCANAVYFDTVKRRFPEAHIDNANGSSQENRDYIRKEGKYLNSEKKETNIPETFEEYGTLPLDTVDKNKSISADILEMIKDGYTDTEILDRHPSCYTKLKQIEAVRQAYLSDKFSKEFRHIEVSYIYGDTETGKTRYVMDTYGYENVYKITDYSHPFDRYKSENIILFDEFRSSLTLKDMLQYLDGYPCSLPARYENKTACFTKVFIVSNIPLEQQYPNIQAEEPESWNAFVRRINNITLFKRPKNKSYSFDTEIEKIDFFPSDYFREGDYNIWRI